MNTFRYVSYTHLDVYKRQDTVTATPSIDPAAAGQNADRNDAVLLHACRIDASQVPDLVPVLAVVAAASVGTTEIYNAGRLRIKESDRIAAMRDCLERLGVSVEEREEGMLIHGKGGTEKKEIQHAVVSGFNDHRIVMAMTVAAVALGVEVTIQGAEAVEKSYPTFFREFERLGGITNVL